MAIWNPTTGTRSEWKLWLAREDVTFRLRTAIGAYTDYALTATGGAAKRRATQQNEAQPSNGVYQARRLKWLLPDENLPSGVQPKSGDVVRDGESIDWTILSVMRGKFGNTWHCESISLSFPTGTSTTGTLSRPSNAQDSTGRPAGNAYTAIAVGIVCRVQGTTNTAADVLERRTMPNTATAYLLSQVDAHAKDIFVSGGVTWNVKAVRNPQLLDKLLELDLEQIL